MVGSVGTIHWLTLVSCGWLCGMIQWLTLVSCGWLYGDEPLVDFGQLWLLNTVHGNDPLVDFGPLWLVLWGRSIG